MTIYSLDEVLKMIIDWEKELSRFYDIAEDALEGERALKAVAVLKERLRNNIKELNEINVHDYENVEMIKNLPDYKTEGVIPRFNIDPNESPEDIFTKILEYEEKVLEYYNHLKDVLNYEKSKDLLDMLLTYKLAQIKEIKGLLDGFDLAV